MWVWPAAADPIQPLAWELPYAASAALKSQKKKKKISRVSAMAHRVKDPTSVTQVAAEVRV